MRGRLLDVILGRQGKFSEAVRCRGLTLLNSEFSSCETLHVSATINPTL